MQHYISVTPTIFRAVGLCLLLLTLQSGNAFGKENVDEEDSTTFQQMSSFEFDLESQTAVVDPDQTNEGRAQLRKLEETAANLYKEYKMLQEERKPLAMRRDTLQVEFNQFQVKFVSANLHGNNAIQTIAKLQLLKRGTPVAMHGPIDQQLDQAESVLRQAKKIASTNQHEMELRAPKIAALNNQIAPIEQLMLQRCNELNECRNQWCAVRQPALKFARGDFESLRRVLDDWLRIDGLWPSAYVWGSLCAYELGDAEGAVNYIHEAEKLRTEVYGFRLVWPAVSASHALVIRDLPGDSSRNFGAHIRFATTRLAALERSRTNTEWDAYFILGRYYSEKEQEHGKAKASYNKALEHNPQCCCSQLGLARLQVNSRNEKVRDVEQGLATLEKLWNRCSTKPWRLAGDLARAYDAAGQPQKARDMWLFVQQSSATDVQKAIIFNWLKSRDGTVYPSDAGKRT